MRDRIIEQFLSAIRLGGFDGFRCALPILRVAKATPCTAAGGLIALHFSFFMPPLSLENYELHRDADESDEDYAFRRSLFQ